MRVAAAILVALLVACASARPPDRRGPLPKYESKQQTYWTAVGVEGDAVKALVNEEGMIEVGERSFSIEPFLHVGGRLVTWSGAAIEQSLQDGDLPTSTPLGDYVIYSKMPSKHMGSVAGGEEVEASGGFTLPGVPWTSFFRNPGGYALHGTYWHNNFGLQMSHGCVNMRNQDALFLFRWTTPVFDPLKIENHADWEVTGHGTRVRVY